MFYRKLLLFFFLIFISLSSFGAVFVVTSNADSGPGTLRDALTQAAANGNATQDIIQFNLPDVSVAGRTITLLTQLPYVSSSLVIDGTTQPGAKLGRSDAKIILQRSSSSSTAFSALILVDANGVEIYGLYIRDFNGNLTYNSEGSYYTASAVFTETSSNVQIGAPGKGNVFANDGFAENSSGASMKDGISPVLFGVNNLKFYSNIVNFEADGKTYRVSTANYSYSSIALNICQGDIRIGDNDVATRNVFGNGASLSNYASGNTLHPSTIQIKNNYFGYDIDGIAVPIMNINLGDASNIYLAQYNPAYNSIYPYTINISYNKFQWPCLISSGHITGDFTMQGNKLLYEPSVPHPLEDVGIGAGADGNILIGGINPGEANILYGEEIDLFSRKSVLLQHNSIYCESDFRGIWYPNVAYLAPPLPLPVVNITNITTQSISGTATPLSKVELFWDDDCYYCEPLTYVTTINADANGNWSYNGIVQKGVIASATLNGFTSLFTKHAVYVGGKIAHSSCSNGNGSITGTVFQNTGGYQWKNTQGQIIGTDSEIKNLQPGTYTLSALNGTCSRDYTFVILDATPKINESNKTIVQPSCNNNSGSVTGIYLENYDVIEDGYNNGDYNVYAYKWIDADGNIVSNTIDLNNVPPGTYHLEVSYKNQCTTTYGPITLKNTTAPNIDQSKAAIQSTNCGQSTGSITNLIVTGTGTLKYSWLNAQQQQVATTQDLVNQPAGIYKLQVTDDTQCGPVFTTDIQIPETNGITLDETNAQTSAASCNKNNGSVTGIKVTGASLYQWTDVNNKAVATTPDLTNVASGDYVLTVSNSSGCSKTSKLYHVGQTSPTVFPVYNATIVASCFGDNSGSVSVAVDALVKSVRWVNSQGQDAGATSTLNNVKAGTYQLYVTDQNGCENYYNTYTVTEIPAYIVANYGQVTNEQCGLKNGGVTATTITGGVPPYTYKWTNAAGDQVGATNTLTNVAAGTYILNVVDTRCGNVDITYPINEESESLTAPSVSNLQLCSAGSALIPVNNPSSTAVYRLYDDASGATPLQEKTGGKFTINIAGNRSFYISQVNGSCESPRTQIDITVGLSAINIPNAFTPNGDGINDYWNINGIENYPDALIQIFTRYGQKIFESRGYPHPFDGTYGGKALPVGTYYYIINLGTNCNLLSGSITLIR